MGHVRNGFGILGMAALCASVWGVAVAPGWSVEPINAGSVVSLDLPTGSAQSIQLDILQGRFANQSVGRLKLDAQDIDFKAGSLRKLGAEVRDGQFELVPVDWLRLDTQAFSFSPMELINHRRFILDKPVSAQVALKVSEKSLNAFITNPETLSKLEKSVSKKTGNLLSIKFTQPSLTLLPKNRVRLNLTTVVGDALAAPMTFEGLLAVSQGKLVFQNVQLASNGTPLPVDLASVIQSRLNEMIDLQRLGKNSLVIRANRLAMANRTLEVTGDATLTRLEFGP